MFLDNNKITKSFQKATWKKKREHTENASFWTELSFWFPQVSKCSPSLNLIIDVGVQEIVKSIPLGGSFHKTAET